MRAEPPRCYTITMPTKTGSDCKCLNCESIFYLRSSEIRRGGGKFCSLECRKKYKAQHSQNYLKVGRKAVHRIVAAKKAGRPLMPGETVHHIDGNKLNNSPSNLIILASQSAHMKLEFSCGNIRLTHEQAVRNGQLSGVARRKEKAPSGSI